MKINSPGSWQRKLMIISLLIKCSISVWYSRTRLDSTPSRNSCFEEKQGHLSACSWPFWLWRKWRNKTHSHVNPWLIHVNVWQDSLRYCKVISLQLIKINEKKKKIKRLAQVGRKYKATYPIKRLVKNKKKRQNLTSPINRWFSIYPKLWLRLGIAKLGVVRSLCNSFHLIRGEKKRSYTYEDFWKQKRGNLLWFHYYPR